jgi:hypothetical protein
MKKLASLWAIFMLFFAFLQKNHVNTPPSVYDVEAGSILTFPLPVSARNYGERILESRQIRRTNPSHIPANLPNIPIVLMDDGGFVIPAFFCGEANAPDLSNIEGKPVTTSKLKRSVPDVFTASEKFDVGTDLGSTLSLRYHKKAPIKFNGKLKQ